jgi:UDP-N-acetyl-D-glucosamine dehydrogenase
MLDPLVTTDQLNVPEAAGRSQYAQQLSARIANRSAKVAILGLGYVGLPLTIRFSKAGFTVIGFDIDPEKPRKLASGKSYLSHISSDEIVDVANKRFVAGSDPSILLDADIFVICVPTPLNEHREPDLTFVIKTTETIVPYLRPGALVCLESTTYPGTTDEIVQPILGRRGLKLGRELFIAYSPEREDPGNPLDAKRIPKVCSGLTSECLQLAVELYKTIVDEIVPVSSTRAAELTKLLENIHRAVNIGLVNEMKIVADRMGLNIWEIIKAAATKPYGFVPYYPGPGLGGHCIPIDPFYLTWKAREFGVHTRFIELAGEINSAMPAWVVGKVVRALNARRKPVAGSRVLILGIAYKKNVDDSRETPAAEIIELLFELGADVAYNDPYIPRFPQMRSHAIDLVSNDLTPQMLASFDCAVLVTDHDVFDYELIAANAPLIVDTRGRFATTSGNVVAA